MITRKYESVDLLNNCKTRLLGTCVDCGGVVMYTNMGSMGIRYCNGKCGKSSHKPGSMAPDFIPTGK